MNKISLRHYKKLIEDKQLLGRYGEKLAAHYLKQEGCKILYKNFTPSDFGAKGGEIDIVARDQDILIFIEVKTRSSHYKRAYDAVDKTKQIYLQKGAVYWRRELKQQVPHRFDIIEVYIIQASDEAADIQTEIIWTKNAF